MNNKQKEEFKKLVLELDKYNMGEHIILSVENIENDYGKMTKHIVASWTDVHGVTKKVEELNKYFSGELFAKGITQKVVWIKSSREDKVEYLKENPFGHPALFPVWLESKKVA